MAGIEQSTGERSPSPVLFCDACNQARGPGQCDFMAGCFAVCHICQWKHLDLPKKTRARTLDIRQSELIKTIYRNMKCGELVGRALPAWEELNHPWRKTLGLEPSPFPVPQTFEQLADYVDAAMKAIIDDEREGEESKQPKQRRQKRAGTGQETRRGSRNCGGTGNQDSKRDHLPR